MRTPGGAGEEHGTVWHTVIHATPMRSSPCSIKFPSSDNSSQIAAWLYRPMRAEGAPKPPIVIMAHGLVGADDAFCALLRFLQCAEQTMKRAGGVDAVQGSCCCSMEKHHHNKAMVA